MVLSLIWLLVSFGIAGLFVLYFLRNKRSPNSTGANPSKRYFQRKIEEIISPQLESTYDDAPIDEKEWRFGNFFQRIGYKVLSSFGIGRGDFAHDDITIRVYRRLLLRHSLLTAVEKLSSCHAINDDTEDDDNILRDGILTKAALQSSSAKEYYDKHKGSSLDTKEFNKILNGVQPPELKILTQSTTHNVNASLGDTATDGDDEAQPYILLPAKLRNYNLAVTDLFVEKALSYLNRKANSYNLWAKSFMTCALLSIFFGSLIALGHTVQGSDGTTINNLVFDKLIGLIGVGGENKDSASAYNGIFDVYDRNRLESRYIYINGDGSPGKQSEAKKNNNSEPEVVFPDSTMIFNVINKSDFKSLSAEDIKVYTEIVKEFMKENPNADKKEVAAALLDFIGSDRNTERWSSLISKFIKGFTFYGLLVLLAVFCYRMSRALFDQAERLKDRRHALRQGRLFVHLNGGKMTVDEMEKAFNWNMSSENAFANINPDAQAPWGNVVKEMLKTIRETSKAGIKAAERK